MRRTKVVMTFCPAGRVASWLLYDQSLLKCSYLHIFFIILFPPILRGRHSKIFLEMLKNESIYRNAKAFIDAKIISKKIKY